MFRFTVSTMTCGGCARSVTKALTEVDPNARIETDPTAREVRVDSTLGEGVFVAALAEAGFPAAR